MDFYELELRTLRSQFAFGCDHWFQLRLWQKFGSFESPTVEQRVQVAREVLQMPECGEAAWGHAGLKQLVEHLIGRLASTDPRIRQEATIALGDLGPNAEAAVPALLDRVQSPAVSIHDRSLAAWALGEIGTFASKAVWLLLELLQQTATQSDASQLRRFAADAIQKFTDDPEVLLTVARIYFSDQTFYCH